MGVAPGKPDGVRQGPPARYSTGSDFPVPMTYELTNAIILYPYMFTRLIMIYMSIVGYNLLVDHAVERYY